MNYKLFLICKINDKFPCDINNLIWGYVKNGSAYIIQRFYYYKIRLNLDIFKKFYEYSKYSFEFVPDRECITRICCYITFNINKITYNYIADPYMWCNVLHNLSLILRKEYHHTMNTFSKDMLRKCINILENSLFLIGWKKRIFEYTHSGFRRANFLLDLNNSLYGTPF